MSSLLLNVVLLLTTGIGAVLLLLSLVGANIYDLREARKKREFALHPHAARYRPRPLVSVIVQVCNNGQGLEATVSSLIKSSYRKLEIIIADNASEDNTKKVARTLIGKYSKRHIKLFASRTNVEAGVIASKAYKAYGKGAFILTMTAGQTIDKQTLMQAVRHFNTEPDTDALIFNQRVDSTLSVLGLLQRYEYLLRMRAKKSLSLLRQEYAGDKVDAVLCKKEVFMKSKAKRTLYANDALISVPAAPSLDALLRQRYELQLERLRAWHGQRQLYATSAGAVTLLAPILFGYFVYVAIRLHQPIFFILCLIVLTIVLLLTIWGDEHLRPLQKLTYSVSIPITYGLFCLFALLLPMALVAETVASIEWHDLSYRLAVDPSSPPQEERS